MIHNPTLYGLNLPLRGSAKILLNGFVSIRLRGHTAQPGYRELARWLSASTKTVARALRDLEARGYIVRRRRGKKLTNVYFIGHFLYRLLTAGRKIRARRVETTQRPTLDRRELGSLFATVYAAAGIKPG